MKHFISIVSLFLFFASVGQVYPATWNVNNLVDFQTRLTEAQNNGQDDTINVAAGTYNVTTTLSYQPSEARTLTIQGASAVSTVLDGGNSVQIMSVDTTGGGSGSNISIRGLTFRNGNYGAGDGGGLYVEVDDATIIIDNCTFSNNMASGRGGCVNVISDNGGTVFFRNNTVSGTNSSGSFGGAVSISSTPNGTINFENNTVGGNNSAGASGGAVYINTQGGTLNILNNSITGTNTSTSAGGALYADTSSEGTSIISGNTISGSNTGTRGGGIYANTSSNSTLTISNNTISGTNTSNSNDGGGIHANTSSDSTLTFSGNTIYGNNNASTYGGGASINGGSGTTITVVNNTISGTNSASENGGGIRVNAPLDGLLYLANNTITGNSATNNGGGAYIPASGTANIYNNIIRENTAGNGDDLYVDTTDINTDINPVNLFNNILGPNSAFVTANSEDLVVDDITNYSQGGNRTDDPLLGPLQDNGGPTFTRALPSNSPAINVGDNGIVATLGLSTDQRGYLRIIDDTVDIGAYEFGSSFSIPTTTEWGMIIFIVLAGFGAVYSMRKKVRAES